MASSIPEVLLNMSNKIPWGKKEHGLSFEFFDILVAKWFTVIVFQNLKSI